MMRRIAILKVIPLLVLGIIILIGCPKGGSKGTKKEETTAKEQKLGKAPDFTLPELGGGSFTFSSLKGKVVILDFWATWCGPCRMEIPGFIDLYNEYKDRGLEIVGVSLDRNKGAVKPFAEQMGINYITVFGDQEVTQKYGGIRGIPTTFIIDQSGDIVWKQVGAVPKEAFEDEIKKLISEETEK